MSGNFMLSDLVGTSKSLLLFSAILLTPGYSVGWLLNLLSFRQRELSTRLALSIPLSIGLCPAIIYFALHFCPAAASVFLGSCLVVFAFLIYLDRDRWKRGLTSGLNRKLPGIFIAIAAGWVVLAVLALIDWQVGGRLYFPSVSYDYSVRSAITSAIVRTGVPPQNPYFFAGRSFPLRYHYFWFILCAFVQKMAGPSVTPRQSMIAGTVWCGMGLLLLGPLYLRFFQSGGQRRLSKRMFLSAGLLAVTGLDIVPVILLEWFNKGFLASVEWWNDPVTSWVNAVFWVPHHVAALIACMTGFLLIWNEGKSDLTRGRIIGALVAGIIFAGAVGLSVYVTFVFAVFLAVWTLIALSRGRRGHAGLICISGALAVFVAGLYLMELFCGNPDGKGGAELPLAFAVKPLRLLDTVLGLSQTGGWKTNLFNLAVLPLNYCLELGFFLVVGIAYCVRMWRTRHLMTEDQLCGLTMAATSMLVCTFVRSNVIANNDLGWRGFLIAQFVLLIWGSELLAGGLLTRSPRQRALIAAMIALGIAGSIYELVKVRFTGPLADMTSAQLLYKWLSPDRNLGARTYALRQVYEDLKKLTPADAVFQHNPNTDPEDLFEGMYADRQVAAETMNCGVVFGGDPGLCRDRIELIDDIFENSSAIRPSRIDDICHRLSINVLVVKDTDQVWKDPQSWIWQRKPLTANNYARAFDCGVGRAN